MADITIDDVVTAVAAEDTVINSAIAYIVSVPGLVAAAAASAGIDQTKAAALVADVQSQTNAIITALPQNTAATSPPATVPTAVAAMKKKLGIH